MTRFVSVRMLISFIQKLSSLLLLYMIDLPKKTCCIHASVLVCSFLFWTSVNGQTTYKSLEGTHHITIESPTNQLKVGESIEMEAISNRNYKNFIWSSEYPGIASVENGKVTALNEGEVLITVKAKEDPFESAYLLSISNPSNSNQAPVRVTDKLYFNNPEYNKDKSYRNNGILLFPADVDAVPEWPEIAAKAGLNTVGIHPGGGHLEGIIEGAKDWIMSDDGKNFLANCRKYGIEVEYEIHAIKELVPRDLFNKHPTVFRMDKNGIRQQQHNFCTHSRQALELLAKSVVEFARIATPSTGRYYFWIDDGFTMCHPDAGDIYSDSDQALMMENYLLRELRKYDPRATIAHLAYNNTLVPPKKIKPSAGVFLEFAPISRDYTTPYSKQRTNQKNQGWNHLEKNLKVFPANTAQVLEYWTDVSKWSGWKRPFKELPWNMTGKFLKEDIEFYRGLGIKHITSFGNGLDGYYKQKFGFDFLQQYGAGFKE